MLDWDFILHVVHKNGFYGMNHFISGYVTNNSHKHNKWLYKQNFCMGASEPEKWEALRLLHTSDVSAIASERTFTLEHKRRKQDSLYLALTIALTFCRFTLEDFWHKRNRKLKTSTRKTKFSFFLRLRLRLRFSSLHTRFFCVAIAIALALTSLVWSRLYLLDSAFPIIINQRWERQ